MALSLNATPKIKGKLKLALMAFYERDKFHVPAAQTCWHPLVSTQLRQVLQPRSSCPFTKIHQRVFLRRELYGPASPVQRGENPWLWRMTMTLFYQDRKRSRTMMNHGLATRRWSFPARIQIRLLNIWRVQPFLSDWDPKRSPIVSAKREGEMIFQGQKQDSGEWKWSWESGDDGKRNGFILVEKTYTESKPNCNPWECSEISMSLSIGWITFRLVALVCVFHLTSLACFLPRVFFVLISWLDTPLHFVVTYSILWDMFIDHLFTLHTSHGLGTSFFVWSLVRFSTRCSYFHYRKVKGTFSYSHFFSESCLDHLTIFSLMKLKSKVELKIYVY